jgi:hypothetical protein
MQRKKGRKEEGRKQGEREGRNQTVPKNVIRFANLLFKWTLS